jgi:hypothetical protein
MQIDPSAAPRSPGHPLPEIRGLARDVLAELSRSFARLYGKDGRPSVPPEQLLSALLLRAPPLGAQCSSIGLIRGVRAFGRSKRGVLRISALCKTRDVSVEIPNRHSVSYGTKRARSAAYSFAEIEPLNLSRSSFSSSSATLKPTKWRNSSRACWVRAWFRSAMPRPCVNR